MDGLTQAIVDFLRKGKEARAIGPMVYSGGTPKAPPGVMPVGKEPKHDGRTYDATVDQMVGGR